ncbi:alpha/beta hydrolase [Oxynema aestuarii]|uniref:Alpha/beta hydrolase n=1 Tax=Oxynema aestuarii AP17 TaxID=2064643 RepID=A0A6H1U1B3_9CYAN|nr:alpha/beta hydrolase [Oxynema aestuarii]QIZ72236.1 alpha/beta hydrolase [Oxynema aestuarii AP17]
MNTQITPPPLPQEWKAESVDNDSRWLESIIKNTAPFSDAWIKARIVQLTYPPPPNYHNPSRELGGDCPYLAASSIAEVLERLHDLCPDRAVYSFFDRQVDEAYITRALFAWDNHKFTQSIGRNFEVFQDRTHPNVFLVTSTATPSLDADRKLPDPGRFRPLFNVDELGAIVAERGCEQLTLRTHGYATPSKIFYPLFSQEADALTADDRISGDTRDRSRSDRALNPNQFYIGYHWPSEQPITSAGLWTDFSQHRGILWKFTFVLGGFAGILGTLIWILLKGFALPILSLGHAIPGIAQLWEWLKFGETAKVAATWYWIVPTLFLFWIVMMHGFRILVYQRDLYRAIHYGSPDLAEFFWRLDAAIAQTEVEGEGSPKHLPPIRVNAIGHSMGACLLVNTLRILSDRFGKDDLDVEIGAQLDRDDLEASYIGKYLLLDKLVLASPDIPLEFLREGRNNYVRSAMRRCRQIYLMSSDRDAVLRYMPTLGNWFIEPSIEMSGYRLGNVFLQRQNPEDPNSRYVPKIRNMFEWQEAVIPTSAYDLFRRFNYLDCSEIEAVNGIRANLTHWSGPAIDLGNMTLFVLRSLPLSLGSKLPEFDLHGGYFFTDTLTFRIIRLLIASETDSPEELQERIWEAIAGSPIRFLPSDSRLR